jgi:acyl-CoA dehydrogenase
MADRTFLDWPFFDESHRRLGQELDEWCTAELHADHGDDVDAECRTLVRKLGEAGWLRYCVPASHGGVHEKLDVRSLALIRETLARHSGLADFVFAMQGLGSGTISLFGSEEQKAAVLPRVAEGSAITAFALTDPGSGSDVANMETTAERTANGWRVDGGKTYISNGGIADTYVLFARTGEAPGAKGISAFLVPADTPGLEVAERIQVIAPHPLATLHFDGMTLPSDALIGESGRGFAQAMATLDVFRTTVGAAALGFARRALDEATSRALDRKLGGGKLADNAITQSKLAEMVLDVETSALLIYRAAWLRDVRGVRNTREAAR